MCVIHVCVHMRMHMGVGGRFVSLEQSRSSWKVRFEQRLEKVRVSHMSN